MPGSAVCQRALHNRAHACLVLLLLLLLLPLSVVPANANPVTTAAAETSAAKRTSAALVDVFDPAAENGLCFRQPVVYAPGVPGGAFLAFATGRNKTGNSPTLCSDPGDGTQQLMVVKRSTDGGFSWSEIKVLHAGHPDFYVHISINGTSHLVVFQDGESVYQCWSHDGGLTWSSPSRFPLPETKYSLQPSVGSGLVLTQGVTKGRLVLPFICHTSTATAPHVSGDKGECPSCHSCLLLSDDGGASWNLGAVGGSGTRESAVVELPKRTHETGDVYSELLLSCRNMSPKPGHRIICRASQEGERMGNCGLVADLPEPVTANWTGIVAGMVCMGSEVFVSTPADAIARQQLTLFASTNGGADFAPFPAAQPVWGGPAGYSSLARVNSSHAALLFENGRLGYADRISFQLLRLAGAETALQTD